MAESVWDYPRPPSVEASARRIRVELGGETIVDTRRAQRVRETSHPPVYYIATTEIAPGVLVPSGGRTTFCEWKGIASYYDVVVGDRRVERAAWAYHDPRLGFEQLRDAIAFYPGRMDACYVDDERVVAQPGDFYGGWITSDVVGPFKGEPGTRGW
ncbi:MAG TPA: DUF427 domain-containing protein [Gaiellaceae bacterium]|nr:DUF427 domain-containing protein [Gaiellaceae bacterium]